MGLYKEVVADAARWPDPRSLPPGAETAPQTYTRFLRNGLAPAMRTLGLKGSGGRFHLARGALKGTFDFQKSVHNTKGLVEFTINWLPATWRVIAPFGAVALDIFFRTGSTPGGWCPPEQPQTTSSGMCWRPLPTTGWSQCKQLWSCTGPLPTPNLAGGGLSPSHQG